MRTLPYWWTLAIPHVGDNTPLSRLGAICNNSKHHAHTHTFSRPNPADGVAGSAGVAAAVVLAVVGAAGATPDARLFLPMSTADQSALALTLTTGSRGVGVEQVARPRLRVCTFSRKDSGTESSLLLVPVRSGLRRFSLLVIFSQLGLLSTCSASPRTL